ALDRGANDALPTGFCPDELSLRLTARLREKMRADQLRDTMRNGLRAALIDPMTGLYNRRYALPYLNKIARAARNGTSGRFALMLADLDHFKRINDEYGHLAGDAVLVETAARLRKHLRPDDMIARVGGEEFMIVMPDLTEEQALLAADRLCRRINARPFLVPGVNTPVTVTISIGLVMAQAPEGVDAEHRLTDLLIGQADRALYSAKDGGRNKVTIAGTAA
ncbi:MAG: diguanylate cyclase, partial [Pseudomonadota bacterium]|nr:diguanylate cyclase [Pseudomonadota bacterium]